MDSKVTGIVRSLLWGVAILLLLAAAFDVLPLADNQVIFLALACFVLSGVIKRIAKSSGCCK
jgi:hypothetical protein